MTRGPNYGNLNTRQKRFVDLIMQGENQTKAALKAGYSKRSAETQGSTLMHNPKVLAALAEVRGPEIATVDEVQKHWAQVMRGKCEIMTNDPLAQSMKASELIAKSRGMLTVHLKHSGSVEITHDPGHDTGAWPLDLAEEWDALVEDFAARERELLGKVRAHLELAAKEKAA